MAIFPALSSGNMVLASDESRVTAVGRLAAMPTLLAASPRHAAL